MEKAAPGRLGVRTTLASVQGGTDVSQTLPGPGLGARGYAIAALVIAGVGVFQAVRFVNQNVPTFATVLEFNGRVFNEPTMTLIAIVNFCSAWWWVPVLFGSLLHRPLRRMVAGYERPIAIWALTVACSWLAFVNLSLLGMTSQLQDYISEGGLVLNKIAANSG
jgi:hypothetical protein